MSSGSGSRGGGEIYLAFLAEGLTEQGVTVTALLPQRPETDELAARVARFCVVERFDFRPTYTRATRVIGASTDRQQSRAVARKLATLAVDVIHVNQQVAEDGLDLVRAAALSSKPWISTIHVGRSARDLGARFGGLRDWITQRALRGLLGDHIAVSAASRAQLAARLGEGPVAPRLHTVLNGVPVPDPTAVVAARAKARSDWGVEDGEVVVGMVGRIEAQKDPLALVRHLEPLANNGMALRIVWIGDGGLRRALEMRVGLVTARMPLVIDGWRDDAALRLAGLDIFMMPSRFEGLPLALLEAMHVALPAVARATDGVGEALCHGETGMLCQSDADWQASLEQLVRDPALRARIGAAAQKRARARFSISSMAADTKPLYEKLAG